MKTPVHVATAARPAGDGSFAIAAVLRWDGPRSPRVATRRLRRQDQIPPVYRALLFGLWEARRLGARSIVLATDDADAVAVLSGTASPPAGAVVACLQIRALLYAFETAEISWLAPARNQEAIFAAEAATHCRRPAYSDLPLWAAAS
ncbi:MAG: reverse transcriptase-like protein [Armatimonadetes bacterium]|nr:reverse transcriptase-like protein [Armatimonadota bacterium]